MPLSVNPLITDYPQAPESQTPGPVLVSTPPASENRPLRLRHFAAWIRLFISATLALDLVQLTGLDHEAFYVNPSEVVMIREPRTHNRVLPPAARCAIVTSDGKFISVLEPCAQVRKLLDK
jgi:hypothetical protein